jgi:hypothetical protein
MATRSKTVDGINEEFRGDGNELFRMIRLQDSLGNAIDKPQSRQQGI